MLNRLTSKTKARIISGRNDALLGSFEGCMVPMHSQWKLGQCWLSVRLFFGGQHSRRDVGLPHSQWQWISVGLPCGCVLAVSICHAMLVYRTLSGNGSVLAFSEAVF